MHPFLIGPLIGLVMLGFRKNAEKPNAWVWLVMVIAFAVNAYVLGGWAAYIAHLSHSWSAAPEVTQHWLYFVIGFFGCVGPLASLIAVETGITSFLTAIAFIVFCIWPVATTTLYGWLPVIGKLAASTL